MIGLNLPLIQNILRKWHLRCRVPPRACSGQHQSERTSQQLDGVSLSSSQSAPVSRCLNVSLGAVMTVPKIAEMSKMKVNVVYLVSLVSLVSIGVGVLGPGGHLLI